VALVVRELLTVLGVQTDEASVRRFDNAVRSAKTSMGEASKGASWLQSALGNLAAMGVQAVTSAVVELTRSLLDANVSAGNLRAGLVGATGGVEQAESAWDNLLQFAKETPFQIDEVTTAFIRLTNAGLKNSNRELRAYGDIAASIPNKTILDFIEAVADATMSEWERLKEFGIKAKVEGNKVAVTFKGQTVKIANNAQAIEDHLIALGETNFGGAMERQSKTLGGAISNAKDAAWQFFVAIGDAGATGALAELIRTMSGGISGGEGLAKTLGRFLANAIRRLNRLLVYLGRNMDTVKRIATALGVSVALIGAAKVIKSIWSLAKAMQGLSVAMALPAAEAALVAAILIAVAAAIALIYLAIDDLMTFTRGGESLFGDMFEGSAFAADLKTSILEVQTAFDEAMRTIGAAIGDVDLSIWDVIIGAIKLTIIVIAGLIIGIWEFGKWVMWLSGEITGFIIHFGDYMNALWRHAVVTFKNMLLELELIATSIWEFLTTTFWSVVDSIVAAFWAVVDGIVAVAVAIAGAFVAAFQWIYDLVVAFVDLVVETFWSIVDGVKEVGVAIGDAFAAAFQVVVDTVMSLLEGALGLLVEVVDIASKVVSEIEVFFGGEGEGSFATRTAEWAEKARGATTTAAATTTTSTSNVTVGTVSVTIDGSTEMGPGEVGSATSQGIDDSLGWIARASLRAQ